MISLQLTDANAKEFEKSVTEEMTNPIKHYEKELIAIRTGRAHPSLIEDLKVTCYGTSVMRIKDIATVSTPDARLITIQPWDKAVLADIEKGISTSDTGLTPVNDGAIIRITLPEMTSERRTELVKTLHKKGEDAKIAVRNVRKEFHNLIRTSEKNKNISEDHSRRLNDLLQKHTDAFVEKVDQLTAKKEKEIRA